MTEKFAAYGFELGIPDDWRIEFNSKNTRERGDVAFHSSRNNVFFVSWGKLEEAQRRFRSLEEHRDETIKRIRQNPNIQRAEVIRSIRQEVSGHDGLVSEVVAQRRRVFLGKDQPAHSVLSIHFYCPDTSRYYVAYWHIKVEDEYPDAMAKFVSIAESMGCHPGAH